MKFFFFSRIFCFLTVIYTLISLSFSSTVYTITDLTANDESFECQAKYWTASPQRATNIYTTCNNTYILGGYNVLGSSIILIGGLLTPTSNGDYYQRIYTGIPSHNLIQFSFNLWAVDNWSTSGKFQVQFDSTLIDGFGLTNSLFPSDFCGSGFYKDFQPVNIYGTVAHNSTALTLRIIHYLGKDSTSASVAFRDLTLQFITTPNTTSSSLCGKASIIIPTASQCPCPTGKYKNSSGTCVNCDSSCASCYGPTSSQCYVCSPLAILNGLKCIICDEACSYCYGTSNSECTACSSGYWMMGNSTCIRSCDAPLVRDVSVNPRTCSSPCNSTAYLAWDGTCVATCDSPLKKGGVEGVITVPSCDFPCDATDYLYDNGTCSDVCDAPYVPSLIRGRRFCSYPCGSGQYLFWNSSCENNCDAPLEVVVYSGMKICNYKCSGNEYLYSNGSCLTTCPYPFIVMIESGKYFCNYKCQMDEYLYSNGTCAGSCDLPLVSRTVSSQKFCDYVCYPSQYLLDNGTCSNTCDFPLTSRVIADQLYCIYSCDVGEYLYWNGTCAGSCDPPLKVRTEGTEQYCEYNCCSNQFLAENGTCLNTCPSPLSIRTESGSQYCDYKCNSGEYLYWNGTCGSSCDSPLVLKIEGIDKYCVYICTENQFLTSNGSCENTCAPPREVRIEGGAQYCDYKCSSGEYLYWNGTCENSCDSPLVLKVEGINKYCIFPCTENQFLASNGTCLNTCPSPLTIRTEGGLQYCDFLCNSGEYLYPNGACRNSCISPLVQRTQGTELFCEYLCMNNQYLLDNGTCSNICQTPMTIKIETGGHQYCTYPCSSSSEYVYENGTCTSGCVSPYKIRTQAGKQFCENPCDGDEYSYSNGTCSSQCESPFIEALIGGVKSCIKPCKASEFVLPNGSCTTSCDSPMRQQTATYGKACVGPCDNASKFYDEESKQCENSCNKKTAIVKNNLYLSCSSSSNETTGGGEISPGCTLEEKKTIVRMAQHVIYYDINYPSSLKSVKASRGRTFLSPRVNFDMPKSIEKSIPEREIPRGFARGGELHSNFLVNIWDDLMLMIIVVTLLGVLVIYEKIAAKKNWGQMKAIFGKLVTIFKWNLVIVVFAINLENIMLYAALDLMSSEYDDSLAFGSLFVSLLMLCVTLAFFVFIFIRVKKSSRTNKVLPQTTSTAKLIDYRSYYRSRHAGSQVMYCGFNGEKARINKYFYLMYCVRNTFPVILACCFYNYPVPQSVLQMLISVGVLGYMIWKKPIENRMDNIQLVLVEGLMMLINFCAFLLVILSNNGTYDSKFANNLGDIILFLSTCINGLVLIFLTIKITLQVQEILKNRQGKDKSAWVSLGVILVQQSAFGFEKMSLDSSPPVQETKTLLPKLTIPNNSTISARPETTEMPVLTSARTDFDDTMPSVVTISRRGRRYNPTLDKNCASHLLQRKSGVFSPVKEDSELAKSMTPSELDSPAKILVDPFGVSFAKEQDSPLDSLNGSFSYVRSNRTRRSLLNPRRVATPIEEADQSPRLFLTSQGSPTQRIKRRSERLLSNTRMGSPLFSQLDSTRPVLEDASDAGTSRHLTEMLREKFDIDEVVKPVFTNPFNRAIKTSQSIRMDTVFSTNEDKLDMMLASAFQNGVLDVQKDEING